MKSAVWRRVALIVSLVALTAMSAYGQGRGGFGGGNFGGRGGPGGFGGFGGGGDANFALRDDVKEELDLSDDQISELEDLRGESPNMFTIARDEGVDMRGLRDMSQEEREDAMASVRKAYEKALKNANEDVMDVFKSKQRNRFKELKFQFALSQGNLVNALSGAEVKLDDDEKEELEEAREKVQKELDKRIASLRRELYLEAMQDAGISESKIEDLMGKEFVFDSRQSGFRIAGGGRQGRGGGAAGGRGARGDRGGDRNSRRSRPSSDDDSDDDNPRRRRRPN